MAAAAVFLVVLDLVIDLVLYRVYAVAHFASPSAWPDCRRKVATYHDGVSGIVAYRRYPAIHDFLFLTRRGCLERVRP
jgi:hypothetical protein